MTSTTFRASIPAVTHHNARLSGTDLSRDFRQTRTIATGTVCSGKSTSVQRIFHFAEGQ